jgi:hypothetical protein
MSPPPAAAPLAAAPLAPSPYAPAAMRALGIGIAGLLITAAGLIIPGDAHGFALSYLTGLGFWIAISIGMLLWILIHHILDASWSVALRRLFENWLPNFKWLALLFLPLVLVSWIKPAAIWPWMDPSAPLHAGHGATSTINTTGAIGADILYQKKSAFLNRECFTGACVLLFALWLWLSTRVRKASFAQDLDGDPRWTSSNRVTAAFGIPIMALSLTLAAIYWFKSLEYHWFSTMYGVWFFTDCARGALSAGALMMLWLYRHGEYKGILNENHLHSIGQLMLAFTVFWAYIAFSQYFLIWNANIPEETFWYNLRELNADGAANQWWWVGLLLLFGYFLAPFLHLLSYKNKIIHGRMKFISLWLLALMLIDLCYNTLPALKDAHNDPRSFISTNLVWVLSTVAGVGGICVWNFLRHLPTQKLIPIRDPRITECLTHHE